MAETENTENKPKNGLELKIELLEANLENLSRLREYDSVCLKRYRKALISIASCKSNVIGDVVDVATKALNL